jgi:hypothetical protein
MAEELGISLLSPLYEAVIECDPTAKVEVLKMAVPLTRVPDPRVFVPA